MFIREIKELSQDQRDVPYVALSHCWGKKLFLTTKSTNLANHKKSIAMDALPQTFQDTITVTRKMGVRYLWIDSLCILQDSKEDWEAESVQMCEIYERALFTITSAHSPDAYGGLFVRRDGSRSLPLEITFPRANSPLRILFQPMPRREVVWDAHDLPIYTRAWCLQELVLSTRTLIFDPDGIKWECIACNFTERSMQGGFVRHHVQIRQLQKAISHEHNSKDIIEELGVTWQMQSKCWEHVVQDYSFRKLTKYSDKLIAVAGIADAIQRQSSSRYLAGIWQDHLHMQLLWFVRHTLSNIVSDTNILSLVRQAPPYREPDSVAPSWSWASLNVPVVYETSVVTIPMCEIVSAKVTGPPQHQSGSITIQGDVRELFVFNQNPRLRAEIDRIQASPKYKYRDSTGLKQSIVSYDTVLLASKKPWRFSSTVQALPVRWHPDEKVDEKIPVTFIAISKRPRLPGMSLELGRQVVFTLALAPTGSVENEFRRVGLAEWDDCSWYGYGCAEDRQLTEEAYRRLSKPWSRIKPPLLSSDDIHEHPVDPSSSTIELAYHSLAQMKRMMIHIV
jgi:Heterokaryon incompatibility protein (HET)